MPQYLLLANDYKDAEALQRRMSVREKHFARMRIEKEAGKFLVGGAKLNEQGKMNGSMLVIEVDSEDAARAWVNEDPYIKGGVWENVEILPFKLASI